MTTAGLESTQGQTNWFERHLNWSMVLGCLVAILVAGVATEVIRVLPYASLKSLMTPINLAMPLIPCWWVLRRKSRNLSWLMIAWAPWIGWVIPIILENHTLPKGQLQGEYICSSC